MLVTSKHLKTQVSVPALLDLDTHSLADRNLGFPSTDVGRVKREAGKIKGE